MKINRQEVYNKTKGRCGYCGTPLESDWQVDHMNSQWIWLAMNKPGDVHHIDNLMPSCKICNHYKKALCCEGGDLADMITWSDYMMTFHKRLGRLPKKTQVERTKKRIEYMWNIANRYGITPDKPFDGVFWYQKMDDDEQ